MDMERILSLQHLRMHNSNGLTVEAGSDYSITACSTRSNFCEETV
jgi:hypothetical protein